jgi:hypothetical protein
MPYRPQKLTSSDIHPAHPVGVFLRYYRAAADERGYLLRDNFDPSRVPGTLNWLAVFECVFDGADEKFLCTLCGAGASDLFGYDYTGNLLGEMMPRQAAEWRLKEFREVMDDARPRFTRASLPDAERDFITLIRGVFPVSKSSARIDEIMLVAAPEETRISSYVAT